MSQKFFVIRQISTGLILPDHRTAKTRVEFGDLGVPRLFTKKGGARQARDCWLMGKWKICGDEDGYYAEPPDPASRYGRDVVARRQALKDDIEIVAVQLEILDG